MLLGLLAAGGRGWRGPAAAAQTETPFQRIFIIVFENQSHATVVAEPYYAALAGRGRLLTNYAALAHPSQPNYVGLVVGLPVVSSDATVNLPQTNLVDLFSARGVSWKTYQENYPGGCSAVSRASGGLYVRRHNPFISLNNVRTNPARCANIVNASQLEADIAGGALPQYSFYVPNLNNDGHDTSLAYAAAWLRGFLEPKLLDPNFAGGTLVVLTFDEAAGPGNSGNKVYTLLLGPMIPPGTTDDTAYTHYSLLRLVEDAFALGTLNRNDASAQAIMMPLPPTPTPSPSPTAPPTGTPQPSVTADTPATGTPQPSPSATPAIGGPVPYHAFLPLLQTDARLRGEMPQRTKLSRP